MHIKLNISSKSTKNGGTKTSSVKFSTITTLKNFLTPHFPQNKFQYCPPFPPKQVSTLRFFYEDTFFFSQISIMHSLFSCTIVKVSEFNMYFSNFIALFSVQMPCYMYICKCKLWKKLMNTEKKLHRNII